MTFSNIVLEEIWKLANGNKKEYARLLRVRSTKASTLQNKERLANLKRMLAKGQITKEEYNEKIANK